MNNKSSSVAMTTKAKRVPNNKGFEAQIPKVIKVKKEPSAKVVKHTESIADEAIVLSAPPKDYCFNQESFRKMRSDRKFVTMSVEGYPLCCGAMNMFGFPSVQTKQNRMAIITKSVETARAALKGMITCITNDAQEADGWKDSLVEYGFIPVFKSSNPNHSNRTIITLWCYNIGSKDFSKEYNKIEDSDTGLGSKRIASN